MAVMDFYKKIKTPCFIVDRKILDNNINIIKENCKKLDNDIIISYSLKTNSLPYLIEYFDSCDLYIEVVSSEEYEYAKSLGVDEKKIIFNGPIKKKELFLNAVSNRCFVNIDSFQELDWLLKSKLKNISIGIRINLPIDDDLKSFFEYPDDGSKFGFEYDDAILMDYIYKLKTQKNIVVSGLHFHCNTNNRNLKVYEKIINHANKVVKKYNLRLDYLDIGGGFYGGDDKYLKDYVSVLKKSLSHANLNNIKLILEPGAALIATTICYVTKVVDTKILNNNKFVVLDGSRLHIDPTFSDKKYIYKTNCSNQSNRKNIICGFSCMERDRIYLDGNFDFSIGDYILFKNMGAYTMTFNANFICSYPVVYLQDNNTIEIIRNKRKLESFLR